MISLAAEDGSPVGQVDTMASKPSSPEVGGSSPELQRLRTANIALQEAKQMLIQELGLRCDRIIQLEVELDAERTSSARVRREQQEEADVSQQLRAIMSDLDASDGGSSRRGGAAPPLAPPPSTGKQADAPSGVVAGLRARVVELELQRRSQEDKARKDAEDIASLRVQVVQLKNLMQTLSSSPSSRHNRAGEVKLAQGFNPEEPQLPPCRVPGVDPSVLYQLHTQPWLPEVQRGIQQEEVVHEWQAWDSYNGWSAHPPSLPPRLGGLPRQPPQAVAPVTSGGSPAKNGRGGSPSSPGKPASGGVLDPLRRLGGAAAGLLLKPPRTLLTDPSVTRSFSLEDVQLPNAANWAWVGGWLVDTEAAGSDPEGWVYGESVEQLSDGSPALPVATQPRTSAPSSPPGQRGAQSADAPLAGEAGQRDHGIGSTPDAPPAEGSLGQGSDGGQVSGGLRLRRRRLRRQRMVVRVEGAHESTTAYLHLLGRCASQEVLVRKLSDQVVSLQAQLTDSEARGATLASNNKRLQQIAGRWRQTALLVDGLQQDLTEARNELKVLRGCAGVPPPQQRTIVPADAALAPDPLPGGSAPPGPGVRGWMAGLTLRRQGSSDPPETATERDRRGEGAEGRQSSPEGPASPDLARGWGWFKPGGQQEPLTRDLGAPPGQESGDTPQETLRPWFARARRLSGERPAARSALGGAHERGDRQSMVLDQYDQELCDGLDAAGIDSPRLASSGAMS